MRSQSEWNTPTRRGFIKRAMMVSAGAVIAGFAGTIGVKAAVALAGQPDEKSPGRMGAGSDSAGTHGLTPSELAMVSALAGVLIPSDGNGPGALDVGVVEKIDRMVTENQEIRTRYREGLQAFDQAAQAGYRKHFADLSADRQRDVVRFVADARTFLWDTEARSFWEKLERKATWYYYRWYGVTNDTIDLFDTVYAHTTGLFYSSKAAWDWLEYEGPPFPFGYVGRVPKCGAQGTSSLVS